MAAFHSMNEEFPCSNGCIYRDHCQGCSQRICRYWDTTQNKCTQTTVEIQNDFVFSHEKRKNSKRILLEFFTPLLNLQKEQTYIWRRTAPPAHIIIPYSEVKSTAIDSFIWRELNDLSVSMILQLPSEDHTPLPFLSVSDIKELSNLPLVAVMTGFTLDLRDYPKMITWRAVKRTLTQVSMLLQSLDLPIIATLPGAFSDQMQHAVKELSELGIHQVAIRGGMYSLIKLHSKVNTYLDIIHQEGLEPILYWDLWWIPSRLLRVKHFYGGSWWQFGLHRFKFARKKHVRCQYIKPAIKKGSDNSSKSKTTEQIIDSNYSFLINGINSRNKKRTRNIFP